MALPEVSSPWPPPAWVAHYDAIRVDDAWYSGDRRRLEAVYANGADKPARRRLWKRRTGQTPNRREHRLHVPLPGDIASTSADLLFATMPNVTVADTATQARLSQLFDEGRVQQTLLSAAEQSAALGGVFLRATWDKEVVNRPILSVMQPDGAMPEYRYGMLRAVNFWRELPGSTTQVVWRHVERHESGHIVHALYQGTGTNLGRLMSLADHTETAELIPSLSDNGVSIETGIKELTAAYLPNMLPNRLHRGSPTGRSDYAAPIYDQFDALDETWTSWMRDLRLARGRLIVPDAYLRSEGVGQGASFDDDRDVWSGLKMPPNDGNAGITLAQFKIRVAEHSGTAEALMRQAVQSAGYTAASFGLEGNSAPITATEVDSRDQRSMVTRSKKAGYAGHPVADMGHVMLMLDVFQFGNTTITPERPTVDFGDGVAESAQSIATTLDLLTRANALSTKTKVKILNPTWDEGPVNAEVAAILAETGAGQPDPVGNFPLG